MSPPSTMFEHEGWTVSWGDGLVRVRCPNTHFAMVRVLPTGISVYGDTGDPSPSSYNLGAKPRWVDIPWPVIEAIVEARKYNTETP